MSKDNLNEIRHDLLSRIEEEFVSEMVPAHLSEKDQNGVEVLAADLMVTTQDGYDALGEFFFLPGNENDELQFFVNLITIQEELPEENLPELCVAVSAINTFIITGAFAIDAVSKSLVYKNTYAMPADITAETLQDNMELSMGLAVEVVRQFGYLLVEVNQGKRTAESVIDMFIPAE